MTAPLTDRQQQLLDFEREWWTHTGHKAQAVADQFGHDTLASWWTELDSFIHGDAALAHDPTLTKRLRRLSAQHRRQTARSAR